MTLLWSNYKGDISNKNLHLWIPSSMAYLLRSSSCVTSVVEKNLKLLSLWFIYQTFTFSVRKQKFRRNPSLQLETCLCSDVTKWGNGHVQNQPIRFIFTRQLHALLLFATPIFFNSGGKEIPREGTVAPKGLRVLRKISAPEGTPNLNATEQLALDRTQHILILFTSKLMSTQLTPRAVFTRVSKVISVCFDFALLRSLIGWKTRATLSANERQYQNQSQVVRAHFPAPVAGCMQLLQILIGSLSCLRLLWLVNN